MHLIDEFPDDLHCAGLASFSCRPPGEIVLLVDLDPERAPFSILLSVRLSGVKNYGHVSQRLQGMEAAEPSSHLARIESFVPLNDAQDERGGRSLRLSLQGCDPIHIVCGEAESTVLSGSTRADSSRSTEGCDEDLCGFEILEQEVLVGKRVYRVAGVGDVVRYASDHPRDAEVPYWAIVWEASIGLGTWILDHPEAVRSKRVLELGCGLGLSGIVAASAGGRVTQTDRAPQALHLAAENALRNGLEPPNHFLADWRTWEHPQRYDVVLGSDLVYETSAVPWLVPLFGRNVRPGGELLLSAPVHREPALQLVDALYADGWQFHTDSVWVDWQRQVTEIAVWHGRRR